MSQRQFHFTLGPVQGFVAQARRTRDFWAGSFILSWLAAVAMRAVQHQGGSIVFPRPDKAFMDALEHGRNGPIQGTVPNRFKAQVTSEFEPHVVEQSVRSAWWELAEHIWQADLGSVAGSGSATRTVWERQISRFWDIQWAIVDDAAESNTLDRLKNWRTHTASDEAGVKCMMMEGWQELSGADGPGRRPDDPTGPNAFWRTLRKRMLTDLRDGEVLCATAFVKRRFSHHFHTFRAQMPGGWTVCGWKVPRGVPSVHYMAAAPWLAKLLEVADQQDEQGQSLCLQLAEFHDAAYALIGEYGEWQSNIACVKNAPGKFQWKALDGSVFFDSMLENARLWSDDATQQDALTVLGKLKRLRETATIGAVSPFYAVLLMDGDELGIHMSDLGKQPAITEGLAKFTAKVKDIVEAHNGFLVYAGGDDVLALLPLEDALSCAVSLRQYYLGCFDRARIPTSLSGAIEYAHIKMPLGKVLHDAHDLLDDIAKERRGRDAIACRVWKPGGLAVEWAMPWECALQEDGVVIEKLAQTFRENTDSDNGDQASQFFYRIRERFDLLNPASQGEPILDVEAALEVMAMEYLNSGLVRDKRLGMAHAKEKIWPLLEQCYPVTRNKEEQDVTKWARSQCLDADGALLVRFLAQKGVER